MTDQQNVFQKTFQTMIKSSQNRQKDLDELIDKAGSSLCRCCIKPFNTRDRQNDMDNG